jgi:hypothetical protein
MSWLLQYPSEENYTNSIKNILIKKDLENIVKERTKSLDTKVAQLEKMNKLMVGRELRMAELSAELGTGVMGQIAQLMIERNKADMMKQRVVP